MKRRKLFHTGTKGFQCEVCDKRFYHKSDLKRHMLTHTKLKTRECDICKKKFAKKSSLVKYFRAQLGEKL